MTRNAVILAFVSLVTACSTAPYTGRKQLSLIPSSQMNAMGAQAYDEILKSEPQVKDQQLAEYVKCVVNPIIETTKRRHGNVPRDWRVGVFAVAEPNAFALPGGNVGVNVGILKVA